MLEERSVLHTLCQIQVLEKVDHDKIIATRLAGGEGESVRLDQGKTLTQPWCTALARSVKHPRVIIHPGDREVQIQFAAENGGDASGPMPEDQRALQVPVGDRGI